MFTRHRYTCPCCVPFFFGNTCRLWLCAASVPQLVQAEDMGQHSTLDAGAHRLVGDGMHLVASAEGVAPGQASEDMHNLDAQVPFPMSAQRSNLGKSIRASTYWVMRRRVCTMMTWPCLGRRIRMSCPLDPDTGLALKDQVEDMDFGRLYPLEDVERVVLCSSHLGLGRPGEGTEDEEVLVSPPFAPCELSKDRGVGDTTGQVRSSRMVDAARKQPRLTGKGKGRDRRGVGDL